MKDLFSSRFLPRFVIAAIAAGAVAATLAVPAFAADKVTARTDWFHSSYHSPFFIGIEKGFYAEVDIDLTMTEGRGSGQVVQLVGTGEDEFGFASVDAVFRGVLKGIPVKAVANIMPFMGQAVYVLKSSGITEPEQLKGVTIAMSPGGTNEALLPAFLKSIGLKDSDLNYVTVGGAAKVRMFMNGDFEAMMATAWAEGIFASVGGANRFVYSDYGVKMVGYNIIASQEVMDENPDLVRRFVAATLKSWQYAIAHPEEALDALGRASEGNAKPDRRARNSGDLAAALEFVGNAVEGRPFGFQSESEWVKTREMLLKVGVIDARMAIDRFMTNEFVGANMTN